MIRKIALLEFKLQRRSLIYWVVLMLLLSFLIFEVVLPGKEVLEIAHSSEPVLYEVDGELVDEALRLHNALQTGSFSVRIGWLLYDRILLLSTLLMSLLGVRVWSRDKKYQMEALIHSRNVPARRYVTGKFIGLILAYGSLLLLIFVVTLITSGYLSVQWDQTFNPLAILLPFLAVGLITLSYSIASILFASLIINNDGATFLIHFIYWVYCVSLIGSFSIASPANFMTQWMIRFDSSMDVNLIEIINQRINDLTINRGIYLVVTLMLLMAAIWQYQRRRYHAS